MAQGQAVHGSVHETQRAMVPSTPLFAIDGNDSPAIGTQGSRQVGQRQYLVGGEA